jgi:hypothetical protein
MPAVPEKEVPGTQKAPSAAAKPSIRPEAQLSLPLVDEHRNDGSARPNARKETWSEEQSFSLRSRWLGAAGMVALLLFISTWIVTHEWNAHRNNATQAAVVSQPAAQSAQQISASPAPRPAAADSPRVNSAASAGSRADWRVIPFTYNRRTDAEKKVSSLAHSNPELQPAVFTPSGHAPYLVSIGGLMNRDAAYALARRSRSLGLPHDTYAQNYTH